MSDTPNTLSDVDITILNAARGILRQQAKICWNAENSEVRCGVMAEQAEAAIFSFLSTFSAYMHREMSYEQLHNQSAPVPVPQSLRAPRENESPLRRAARTGMTGAELLAEIRSAPDYDPPAQSLRA